MKNWIKSLIALGMITASETSLAGVLSLFGQKESSSDTASTASASSDNQDSMGATCGCSEEEIGAAVESYLDEHPEAVVNAIMKYRQHKQDEMQKKVGGNISQHVDELFGPKQVTVVGNPDAPITVVEFMDYQCGHCRSMDTTINELVKEHKDVRVVIREFPIFGGNSLLASKAAIASAAQGKYAEFHSALLNLSMPLTEDKIYEAAEKVGLDVSQLKDDMNSSAVNRQIRDTFALARAININATPAFVVGNGEKGDFEFRLGELPPAMLEAMINQVKSKASAPAQEATQPAPAEADAEEAGDEAAPAAQPEADAQPSDEATQPAAQPATATQPAGDEAATAPATGDEDADSAEATPEHGDADADATDADADGDADDDEDSGEADQEHAG